MAQFFLIVELMPELNDHYQALKAQMGTTLLRIAPIH
jgi:hypothetical protein